MDQIVDLENIIKHIDDAHSRAVPRSLRHYTYDYVRGKMTVYLCSAVNLEIANFAIALQNIHGEKYL